MLSEWAKPWEELQEKYGMEPGEIRAVVFPTTAAAPGSPTQFTVYGSLTVAKQLRDSGAKVIRRWFTELPRVPRRVQFHAAQDFGLDKGKVLFVEK